MTKFFKVLLYSTVVVLFGMAIVSCGKPRIIPDERLARMFRDIYLTNAYNQTHRTDLDSLNIYEPIFSKYGYTSEDVQFTIGNFAKRKSARLSDVVDRAITLLEEEANFYEHRIAVHDTIGRIARERYATTLYTDSLIEVRKIADTSRLRIVIPVDEPGIYDLSYTYIVDSADRNNNLRVNQYLVDKRKYQSSNVSRRLKRFETETVSASFTADKNHRELVINLNGYPKDLTKPNMTVKDLTVKRYLPDRIARDSLGKSWMDYRVLDSLSSPLRGVPRYDPQVYVILPDEKDLVTLPADSGRTPAP